MHHTLAILHWTVFGLVAIALVAWGHRLGGPRA
jgi:hypothetical protein